MHFERGCTGAWMLLSALLLSACGSGDTDPLRTAVYVNAEDIVSLEIRLADNLRILDLNDPEPLTLPLIGTRSDGEALTVSQFVQWSSSAPEVIAVTGSGVATGVSNGVSTITAVVADLSATIELTASNAALVSIAPAISDPVVPVCSFENTLSALGTYDDTTVRDISRSVSWTSSDTSIARVIDENGANTVLALKGGAVALTAVRGAVSSAPIDLNIAAGTLGSIALAPATVQLEVDEAQDFVATGTYADTTTRDVTRASVWTSSVTTALTVDPAVMGRFNAVDEGSSLVSALCDDRMGTASVEVVEPVTITGIEIRDQNRNQTNLIRKDPLAADFQLHAYLLFSDDSELDVTDSTDDEYDDIIWRVQSGSPNNVLTVSNVEGSRGLIEMLGVDNAQVVIEVVLLGESDQITIDSDFDND
jgi:hypothetical protein